MRRNKNRVTYSSCLHDPQDLWWGNTSRDTSEESQESQEEMVVLENGSKIIGSSPYF